MCNQFKILFFIILNINCLYLVSQNDKNLKFVIGGNFSNPHKLIEGTNSHTDIYDLNAFGNLYLGILHKNRFQLNLSSELNSMNYIFNDYLISIRYYFIKKQKLKPFIEIGTILGSYGTGTRDIINQKSINPEVGFLFNLNKIVDLSLSFSYQIREIEIKRSNYFESIKMDRSLFKTGLLFKIK